MPIMPSKSAIIAYNDPFGVWNEIREKIQSLFPLEINTIKRDGLRGSFIHENALKWRRCFSFNGLVNFAFAQKGSIQSLENPDSMRYLSELPYMELYVLPPMSSDVYRENVKNNIKSWIHSMNGREWMIIFGLCGSSSLQDQKTNLKTIEKIKSTIFNMKYRHTRLALIPMDSLALLTSKGQPKRIITARCEEPCRNWQDLRDSMREYLKHAIVSRHHEIMVLISKCLDKSSPKKPLSIRSYVMLRENMLSLYAKCGMVEQAISGYSSMHQLIVQKFSHEKIPESIADSEYFKSPPFVFDPEYCTFKDIFEEDNLSCFSLREHILSRQFFFLDNPNTVDNVYKLCELSFEFISEMFLKLRLQGSFEGYCWLYTFIIEVVKRIESKVESIHENDEVFKRQQKVLTKDGTSTKKSRPRRPFNISDLKATLTKYVERGTTVNQRSDEITSKDGIYDEITKKEVQAALFECVNKYKSCNRFLGYLYNIAYKIVLNLSSLDHKNTDNLCTVEHKNESYKKWLQNKSEFIDKLKYKEMLKSELIASSARYFDRGDLYRFSNILGSLLKDEDSLKFVERDSHFMGWYDVWSRVCADRNDRELKGNLYCWFDPQIPNRNLQNGFEEIQRIICAGFNSITPFFERLSLSPSQLEGEAVYNYLRIFSLAKMTINHEKPPEMISGQFIKGRVLEMIHFKLNICSLVTLKGCRVSLKFLGDEQNVDTIENHNSESIEVFKENVNLEKGLNVIDLEHSFEKICKLTPDHICVSKDSRKFLQRAASPIPMALLSAVLTNCRRKDLSTQQLLTSIMFPPTFIISSPELVKMEILPCADRKTNEIILIENSYNFVCVEVTPDNGFEVQCAKLSIPNDGFGLSGITPADLTDKLEEKEDKTTIYLPGISSKYSMCVSIWVSAAELMRSEFERVFTLEYTGVSEHEKNATGRLERSVNFRVSPAFFSEIIENPVDGILTVVLEALASGYSRIELLKFNEVILVRDRVLLEKGALYNVTLNYEDISGSRELKVYYTLHRRKCVHACNDKGRGDLELITPEQLEYKYKIPERDKNRLSLEYMVPPFGIVSEPFEMTVIISSREEVSFGYRVRDHGIWSVEGPMEQKNVVLNSSNNGSFTLNFRLVALLEGTLRLPSFTFTHANVHVPEREIQILSDKVKTIET